MKDVKFEVLKLHTIDEVEKHLNEYAPILLDYKIVNDKYYFYLILEIIKTKFDRG